MVMLEKSKVPKFCKDVRFKVVIFCYFNFSFKLYCYFKKLKRNDILKVRESTYVEFTYINLFCIDNLLGYPILTVKIRIPWHIVSLFCTHFLKLHIPGKIQTECRGK